MTRSAWIACAVTAAIGIVACRGGEPPKQEASGPKGPASKTVEERVAYYRQCWDAYNKHAWDQFKACYADSAASESMGSGRPPLVGADAILADAKAFGASFPDLEGTLRILIARPDTSASIAVLNGTNKGPMPGPDGKPIPATNKPIGFYFGHVIHWNETGDKALREEGYMDTPTMMAQLGLSKTPARPVESKPTAPPTVVISTGSDTERKNVQVYQAQVQAFNKHDAKDLESYNAPDAVFHDLAAPKDLDVKGNTARMMEFFNAFSYGMLDVPSVWGAGDYVVAQGTFAGTNEGPSPMLGIATPTKKSVKVPFLEITRYEGGKVKEDWVALDSMSIAMQLGLMPPPK